MVRSTVDDEVKATASARAGGSHRLGAGIPGHRPVGDHFVDQPPLGPEAGGQPAAHRLGPREQHGAEGSRSERPASPSRDGLDAGKASARASASDTLGHQVGDDTGLGEGGAVPVPTAAHRHRGDRPLSDHGEEPAAALDEVSATHWYAPDASRRAASARAAPASTGSSMAMTGSSMTVAPRRSAGPPGSRTGRGRG